MQPGTYENLPIEEYHAAEGISRSGLDEIAKSPRHYYAKYLDPNAPKSETRSAAFEFGAAFHLLMGEPEAFKKLYAPEPDKGNHPGALVTLEDMKTHAVKCGTKKSGTKAEMKKALQAADAKAVFWDDVLAKASAGGKTLLSIADWDRLHAMQASVLAHRACAALLSTSAIKCEETFIVADPELPGVIRRVRPDARRTSDFIVIDFKTSESASKEAFRRSAYAYRYHVQAAYYLDTLTLATGIPHTEFVFIVVEKTYPYAVNVFVAAPKFVTHGRNEYKKHLLTYAECKSADEWPCYSTTIDPLELPDFVREL